MMIRLLLASTILALASPAMAEHHSEAEPHTDASADPRIMETVHTFMSGLHSQDSDAMMAVVSPGAVLSVVETRDGEDRASTTDMESAAADMASFPSMIEQLMTGEVVMQEGSVATVLARFELIQDGMRINCGSNIFTLMFVNGNWQIASATYSRAEEDCLAAPEG